jgi:hypothetical protein
MAALSSSSDKLLSGFGATCVAGLSGHGGLTGHGGSGFGATYVAGLFSFGVEFWVTALSTYPTTKIAATDNDLILLLTALRDMQVNLQIISNILAAGFIHSLTGTRSKTPHVALYIDCA